MCWCVLVCVGVCVIVCWTLSLSVDVSLLYLLTLFHCSNRRCLCFPWGEQGVVRASWTIEPLALRQTYGYITETHMLKPYDQRVAATLAFIKSLCDLTSREARLIKATRTGAKQKIATADSMVLDWQLDSARFYRTIDFKAFQSGYKASEVHGADRLYYDRAKPIEVKMKYYDFLYHQR